MSEKKRPARYRHVSVDDPERPRATALNKQAVRTLYQDERARVQFRQSFHDSNPSASSNAPFEDQFECPKDTTKVPDLDRAAADLAECVSMFVPRQYMDVEPMNRFFLVDPDNEQTSTQGRLDMAAMRLHRADEDSAKSRVRAATELAQKEQSEAQKRKDSRRRRVTEAPRSWYVERNDESWLDLDDSDESGSDSGSTAKGASRRKRHDSRHIS